MEQRIGNLYRWGMEVSRSGKSTVNTKKGPRPECSRPVCGRVEKPAGLEGGREFFCLLGTGFSVKFKKFISQNK